MSSCGIAVIVQNDTKQLYSTSERGYLMDALMLWGPISALNELRYWKQHAPRNAEGLFANPHIDSCCCIDFDTRNVTLFSDGGWEGDILWINTYLKLATRLWPGWSVKWVWRGASEVAHIAWGDSEQQVTPTETVLKVPARSDFFYMIILHQQFSRTLVIPSGILSLTINSQTRSALMDSDPIEVLGATNYLEGLWKQMTENEIVYDEGSFPIGGTHVDYDNHRITLWHSIDGEIDRIELPSFWAGWTLTDYRRDYEGFHKATPSRSTIIAPSENHYIDSIREWVCHNDNDCAIPHGMDPSFAEKAFATAVNRHHAS